MLKSAPDIFLTNWCLDNCENYPIWTCHASHSFHDKYKQQNAFANKKPCFDKHKANTSNTMIFNIILFANPTVFANFVGFANRKISN